MVPASRPGADAMLARWDAVDGGIRRPQWRRMLGVALGLLSLWVLAAAVNEAWRYQRVLGWFGHYGTGWPAQPHEVIGAGLSARDRFLLFGDLSKQPESAQMRALWESAPDNPAGYAQYAFACQAEQRAFPPDFLATARRLDPDNSWFTYHAAGALAKDSVKRARPTSQAKQAGEAPAWTIVDGAKLTQALALLREARTQPQFVNRHKEFVAARVSLLPQSDRVSRLAAEVYASGHSGSDFNLRGLADAIAAQAWLLGEAGDAAEFDSLLGDAEVFIQAWAGMPHPRLLDVLILKASCVTLTRNLHAAAGKLGLHEAAMRIKRINDRLVKWSEEQEVVGRSTRELDLRCSLGDEAGIRNRWLVKSPPPLTDEDLKPGRMVEHLLASRAGSLAVWVLLGLGMLAVALFRYCLPPWMLRLAQRINALLLPVDWAWMLGAGVLLPFGYVTALTRCTPLGGQEWGLAKGGALILIAADFLALALLMLVMPVLIARWRFGRRAAALGIGGGTALPGWLAVAAGAALVPVLGMLEPPVANLEHFLAWKLALLAPLVLGILTSVVRAMAVTFIRQFSRAVVALALLPAYACGMLLIMVSMPLYTAAQSCWQRHEHLTELTANGIARHEAEVANQLLQEVREVLEWQSDHGVR